MARCGKFSAPLYSFANVSMPGPSQPRKEITRDRPRRATPHCAVGAEENFALIWATLKVYTLPKPSVKQNRSQSETELNFVLRSFSYIHLFATLYPRHQNRMCCKQRHVSRVDRLGFP